MLPRDSMAGQFELARIPVPGRLHVHARGTNLGRVGKAVHDSLRPRVCLECGRPVQNLVQLPQGPHQTADDTIRDLASNPAQLHPLPRSARSNLRQQSLSLTARCFLTIQGDRQTLSDPRQLRRGPKKENHATSQTRLSEPLESSQCSGDSRLQGRRKQFAQQLGVRSDRCCARSQGRHRGRAPR